MTRPMFMELKPKEPIEAYTGTELHCKTWEAEAALRMLMNNLDHRIALDWEQLIVYGGTGRAARNWKEYHKLVNTLQQLEPDETMLVQSGKCVGVIKTEVDRPRVLIANSNIVPAWSTQENFDKYDQMGLTMYGQMTAGSWIYIGTQGILQGTYETLAALANKHFNGTLKNTWTLTAGLGAMSGAQPHAVTMNDGVILNVEIVPERIKQKVKEGYCDEMQTDLNKAVERVLDAKERGEALSVGLVGNAAETHPKLVEMNVIPDIVTDQTSAHNVHDYIPIGNLDEMLKLREENYEEYKKKAYQAMKIHTQAILDMQAKGAIAFDYGNNLRGQAEKAGLVVRNEKGEFLYPGFVPAYVRPLFCEGKGPFRWAALSGDSQDILTIDKALIETFPEDKPLHRWIKKAQEKVPFIGLPTRVCWLGYGERARFGKVINDLVGSGEVKAPIVIGRDHLDSGSVASPNRETEGMKDGSDAIADWPYLNAMANAISGADWISVHNGGGVGIGNSSHAGMVVVATGTKEKEKRLMRVLTTDPGTGIMRHADAGYELAIKTAKAKRVKIPDITM